MPLRENQLLEVVVSVSECGMEDEGVERLIKEKCGMKNGCQKVTYTRFTIHPPDRSSPTLLLLPTVKSFGRPLILLTHSGIGISSSRGWGTMMTPSDLTPIRGCEVTPPRGRDDPIPSRPMKRRGPLFDDLYFVIIVISSAEAKTVA